MQETPRLIEAASAAAETKIRQVVPPDEETLIQVSADLTEAGTFGVCWLVVTPKRVALVPESGPDGAVSVPLENLTRAATEPLVGGGCLELERQGESPLRLTYTGTQAVKFSEVARGIEQLRQQQPLSIKAQLERTRCARCGRLLPEKDGPCPACVRRWSVLGRVAGYLRPYKLRAAALAAASLITTSAQLLPPLITARIIDEVFEPGEGAGRSMEERLHLLGLLVLALVGVRVWSWLGELTHGWMVTWLSARVTADIRHQLYQRLEMLSLQFYDKRQAGGLISRVTYDAGMLQQFLVDGLPYLAINALLILGIIAFLFSLSWKVTLFILIPVPLTLTWSVLFWRRMWGIFHRFGHTWSALSARLSEALNGIRVVKAFTQERREVAAFEQRNDDLAAIARKTARNWFALSTTMGLTTGLGILIVWYFGSLEVLGQRLTLGKLTAIYQYMWLVYGPLEWFAQVNSWMTRASAGAERIFEVIDTPAEAYEDPDAVSLPAIRGEIRFDRVTFGYDKSKPVLRDLELAIKPGEMIGLVGRSGVGKTTTVNLVARFYDVDQGSLQIDGVDVRRIRLGDLRRQVGIVSQDPVLFSGSIAENIGYGKPGVGLAEIMAAARVANAHQFILAKPDGYDTQVGERGAGLSGGERQRLAIARAILHDPRVLILDEATSSVDVQTEKAIQEAIAHLTRGRTTLAIAHRLSTLRHADRLVLLDEGKIVETGTHEELLARKGRFHDLVQLQQEVAQIIAVQE
ncbi:MAG: ABC transporter ATP-binding protein [Candidatus Latescibacterota bacterium]|jgi:ATP-binding cassette subfamily B protein